jgi:hypothetical protein
MRALTYVAVILPLAVGATAEPLTAKAINCVTEYREPLPCLQKVANITPIETLATQDVSVIRALIWAHESLPEFFIQFSRLRSGEVSLHVQPVAGSFGTGVDEVLLQSEWDALSRRWFAQRDAILKADPGPVGCITITAGDFEIVEDGKITQVTIAGCQPTFSFLSAFVAQATRDIPKCSAVPALEEDRELERLESCFSQAPERE